MTSSSSESPLKAELKGFRVYFSSFGGSGGRGRRGRHGIRSLRLSALGWWTKYLELMATRSLNGTFFAWGDQTVQIYGNYETFPQLRNYLDWLFNDPQWTARNKTLFFWKQRNEVTALHKKVQHDFYVSLCICTRIRAISFEEWAWDITDIYGLLVTITRPPRLGKSRKTSEKFRGESWSVNPGWLFYIEGIILDTQLYGHCKDPIGFMYEPISITECHHPFGTLTRWLMTTILDVECERSGGAKRSGREKLFVYTTCGNSSKKTKDGKLNMRMTESTYPLLTYPNQKQGFNSHSRPC